MNENNKQFRIDRFEINIFYDNRISYFSVIEQLSEQKSHMLMWKYGAGFSADEILVDSSSDLEIARTIDVSEFPRKDVSTLLELHPEALEPELLSQLVEILSGE